MKLSPTNGDAGQPLMTGRPVWLPASRFHPYGAQWRRFRVSGTIPPMATKTRPGAVSGGNCGVLAANGNTVTVARPKERYADARFHPLPTTAVDLMPPKTYCRISCW